MQMTKHLMAVVAMAVLALTANAQNAPAGAFELTLPNGYAEYTTQTQNVASPEGQIETINWISRAKSGEAVIVTRSTMPGKILDPQKLITSTRESLLKSLGATLESEEPREGALPSARILFHSDAAWFRARFTVVDDRLYQLLYVGRSAEQRDAQVVGLMFDTFEVPAAAPATPVVETR
jgi:hypothetical protein